MGPRLPAGQNSLLSKNYDAARVDRNFHHSNLMGKLSLESRVELARRAAEHGLARTFLRTVPVPIEPFWKAH